jgi:dihydroflavonol-4-reductase
MMSGKYPGMARIGIPIVDVRNVAQAHLQAAVVPQAKDQRIILVNYSLWLQDCAKMLNEVYPAYKIKTNLLPRCGMKMAALFDKKIKLLLPLWGVDRTFHNAKSKEVLGIEYIDMKKTVTEMAGTLIEYGYVKKK